MNCNITPYEREHNVNQRDKQAQVDEKKKEQFNTKLTLHLKLQRKKSMSGHIIYSQQQDRQNIQQMLCLFNLFYFQVLKVCNSLECLLSQCTNKFYCSFLSFPYSINSLDADMIRPTKAVKPAISTDGTPVASPEPAYGAMKYIPAFPIILAIGLLFIHIIQPLYS